MRAVCAARAVLVARGVRAVRAGDAKRRAQMSTNYDVHNLVVWRFENMSQLKVNKFMGRPYKSGC